MTEQKMDSETVASQLKTILDYVQDCQRRVNMGEIMDLQGLDNNVMEICDAVASLPQPEALKLEPQMMKLIEKLEELATGMKEQQEKFTAYSGGGRR